MSPKAPDPNPLRPALGPTQLAAPWRLSYLQSIADEEGAAPAANDPPAPPDESHASFLGHYWDNPQLDAQHHVVVRTEQAMVLLNAYPYANGHLLVALGEARPRLLDYDPDQRAALWRHVDLACDLLERALDCQGVNIGVNQGRAAGAGVPVHLHVHLVPRWAGDTNFMTTAGAVRVIPSSLDDMAQRFAQAWDLIRDQWSGA